MRSKYFGKELPPLTNFIQTKFFFLLSAERPTSLTKVLARLHTFSASVKAIYQVTPSPQFNVVYRDEDCHCSFPTLSGGGRGFLIPVMPLVIVSKIAYQRMSQLSDPGVPRTFVEDSRYEFSATVLRRIFKDVHAHCYCASLVCTLFMTWRVPRHVFQARASSRNSTKYRADDLCDNLICEYFCWMLGDSHFFFGRSLPFLILSIILKKKLCVGSFNYFSYTIQIGSNWYMDPGVRDLEVACFKANST